MDQSWAFDQISIFCSSSAVYLYDTVRLVKMGSIFLRFQYVLSWQTEALDIYFYGCDLANILWNLFAAVQILERAFDVKYYS